ncbi:hypothetical protein F5Y12DRAFT_547896 [Xylaria sp. FL1777]|nr:hypothetical protein F5Y12DRAFT_547896 [Xylaria sp. FL1777]
MSGHVPTTSLHGCIEASSSLRHTTSANYSAWQPHDDNAEEQPCTRRNTALVEAVTTWREGVRDPLFTGTIDIVNNRMSHPCLRPSCRSEVIKTNRQVSGLSKLRPHGPISSVSNSGVDSACDLALDKPVLSTALDLDDIMANETIRTTGALYSTLHRANNTILPNQCAVIKEFVEHGEHLIALTHALRYSYDFTFEGHPSEVFAARIHVYNLGKKKSKVPGIMMRFYKDLHPAFKRFLARRLLNGVLIRYPKGFFPRTFWVAEGEEMPVILQTYNAIEHIYHDLERARDVSDAIVRQWRWECRR